MAFWDKLIGKNEKIVPGVKVPPDNNLATVKALIAAGADVNVKDTGGMTALHLAVMTGERDAIKALLDVGGAVDFNNVAAPGTPAEPPSAVALSGDIEVRKPLTFKRKG
ncbi:MAG: ankyrin repeat domain-containing protein [Alphaproteobacteria bacterium]